MNNKYFIGICLRGYARNYSQDMNFQFNQNNSKYKPHITIVPPFQTINESKLLKNFEVSCSQLGRLSQFKLIRVNTFLSESTGENILFLETQVDEKIDEFRIKLRESLEGIIETNIETKKKGRHNYHVTIAKSQEEFPENILKELNETFSPIEQYLLRLTLIKNKEVLVEYDFCQKRLLLNGELDSKEEWNTTMSYFTNQTGLFPTERGFVKL